VCTLVEEIAEMFEKCNIQNFLKHIFQGIPLLDAFTLVRAT